MLVSKTLLDLGADDRGRSKVLILPDGLPTKASLEGADGVEDEAGPNLKEGDTIHGWEGNNMLLNLFLSRDNLEIPEPDTVIKHAELEDVVKVGLCLAVSFRDRKDVSQQLLHDTSLFGGIKGSIKGEDGTGILHTVSVHMELIKSVNVLHMETDGWATGGLAGPKEKLLGLLGLEEEAVGAALEIGKLIQGKESLLGVKLALYFGKIFVNEISTGAFKYLS